MWTLNPDLLGGEAVKDILGHLGKTEYRLDIDDTKGELIFLGVTVVAGECSSFLEDPYWSVEGWSIMKIGCSWLCVEAGSQLGSYCHNFRWKKIIA